MELKMNSGVLTVIGENKIIEVDVNENGELEVFGDVVVEEEDSEEELEEVIEFENEPNKPRDAFAHLVDREEAYPIINGINVGDKVRLRLDLDEKIDEIPDIGLCRYDEMIEEIGNRDIEVLNIDKEYDSISDTYEDCLRVHNEHNSSWFLSTRWVIVVKELEKEETDL